MPSTCSDWLRPSCPPSPTIGPDDTHSPRGWPWWPPWISQVPSRRFTHILHIYLAKETIPQMRPLTVLISLFVLFFPFFVLLASLLMASPLLARIPFTKPAKRKALSHPSVVSLEKRKRGGSVHLGANLPLWVSEQIKNYSFIMLFCCPTDISVCSKRMTNSRWIHNVIAIFNLSSLNALWWLGFSWPIRPD